MAFSLKEIFFWVQDVRQYLNVNLERKVLRKPGQGIDYTKKTEDSFHTVSNLHPKRMQLRIKKISQQTPSSKTFHLERLDGQLPPFRPGQYINIFLDIDGILTSRPYSIASPPRHQNLEITVRDKPDGFVAPYILNELKVGDEIETTGPEGHFYHEPLIDGQDLVFLAGGSGITPFMSILREFLDRKTMMPTPKIKLLYGSRLTDDIIYKEELTRLANEHGNFEYVSIISEPAPEFDGIHGFLNANMIANHVHDFEGKTFYICGPNAMYDLCLEALTKLGIPRHKIKRESYGPPDDITTTPGWPAEIHPDSIFNVDILGLKSIRAPAREPLMNTLERYGITIPAICRVGECSACRVRIVKGKVFMPATTGIRESDIDFGYIHACVGYPIEDLQIQV